MPTLVAPTTAVHASFVRATHEFLREGRDEWPIAAIADPAAFRTYVQYLVDDALPGSPRPVDHVPATHLWLIDGVEYLGRVAIRHDLTQHLREVGGHVGYDVRPSARRRGHATAMLRLALPVARGLGIDPALVTCDPGNVASRRVIEANGGRLAESSGTKLRYWIPTS